MESTHPGLQFEYKFFLIWINIEWFMTVLGQAIWVVKIRVFEETCVHMNHACVCMHKPAYVGPFPEA